MTDETRDGRPLRGVRRSAPEPWASAMTRAGIVTRGAPSLRELARRVDQVAETPVEREAVRGWVMGDRTGAMPPAIAQGLAAALGVPIRDVLSWAGSPATYQGAYVPPAEAVHLTPHQRRLVNGMIRALVAGNTPSGGGVVVTETREGGGLTLRSSDEA